VKTIHYLPWGDRIPTAQEVDDQVAAMKPGDCVIYHTGFLSRDRGEGDNMNVPVCDMADRFYLHGAPAQFRYAHGKEMDGRAVNGLGSGQLTQSRVGNLDYEYRFTKVATR